MDERENTVMYYAIDFTMEISASCQQFRR